MNTLNNLFENYDPYHNMTGSMATVAILTVVVVLASFAFARYAEKKNQNSI